MKFVVDLWLDGYEDEEEMKKACIELIQESLDFSASSVSVEVYIPPTLRSELEAGATQVEDQEQECVCGHTLEGHTTMLEDNICTGVGCKCTQFRPKYLPGARKK